MKAHRGKIEALLAAIAPGYKVPPNARFVIEDEKQSPSSTRSICSAMGLPRSRRSPG